MVSKTKNQKLTESVNLAANGGFGQKLLFKIDKGSTIVMEHDSKAKQYDSPNKLSACRTNKT